VIAELRDDAGRRCAPADHRVRIGLGQRPPRQRPAFLAADRPEQRTLGIGEARALDLGGEVGLQAVVAWHGVRPAVLLA
jgi:hypothetical protein